jgi:branched-chain amino acid transport system substrate-binding protein
MSKGHYLNRFNRRTIIKERAAAIGAVQITSPFIVKALGDTPVKVGMIDPLTGVYAAYA